MARRDPDTEATVSVDRLLATSAGRDCMHSTVVPLAHDVVLQSAAAIDAVGVASTVAKLRPLRVAIAPPLVGALLLPTRVQDRAGAENGTAYTNLTRRIALLPVLRQTKQTESHRANHLEERTIESKERGLSARHR